MFGALHVALGALVLSVGTPAVKPAANAVTVEMRTDVCGGLSKAECCAQMIEIAGFRAQGDQLPRKVRAGLRLACGDAEQQVDPQVCRSLLMTRGFDLAQAERVCGPAKAVCEDNASCEQCTRDLRRLDFEGGYNACHAVTYRETKNTGTVRIQKVIVIGKNGKVDTELRFGR